MDVLYFGFASPELGLALLTEVAGLVFLVFRRAWWAALPGVFVAGRLRAAAGVSVAGLEPLGVSCVYSCDIDPTACKWYGVFFGEAPQGHDIRQVEHLPPHEILCAGFPCVAFSRAGQKRGRGDERGRLFDEVVRLMQKSPPRLASTGPSYHWHGGRLT